MLRGAQWALPSFERRVISKAHPGALLGRSGTYDADDGQWFQIALVLRSTRDWDWGRVEYRPLMLPKAGLAGEGQSFANRALTDLARKLLVLRRGYGLCANRRRGLPGGRFDGAYPPPIPGCEEGTRQVRTLARRLASKIARGSTPMRTLYWDRACCGQALYAWWAGVQCGPPPRPTTHFARPRISRVGGREASRKLAMRRLPTAARSGNAALR